MFRRPAALFAATLIDYLIWRLSAGSGIQLLGLISGLLLLPLLILTVGFTLAAIVRRAADGPVSEAPVQATLHTEGTGGADESQERLAA